MRILYLSYHFYPEKGPASIKNTLLASKLSEHKDVGFVHVLTGSQVEEKNPNRYNANSKLIIKRVKLLKQKGFICKIFNYFFFIAFVIRNCKIDQYDMVFASSSRLGTAFIGAFLSGYLKIPLYLEIRDNFTDTIKSFIPKWYFSPLRWILIKLYQHAIRRALIINTLSIKNVQYIKSLNEKAKITCFYHGVDEMFRVKKNNKRTKEINKKGQLFNQKILVYAGNLGFAQNLEHFLPLLSKLLPYNWVISVYGDGNKKKQVAKSISCLENVEVKPMVEQDNLVEIYSNADALLIPLRDSPAFKKSLPSKLFEIVAMGKPIVVLSSGYVAEFLENNFVEGVYIFTDQNINDFTKTLVSIDNNHFDRTSFIENWSRKTLIDAQISSILSIRAEH